MSDLSDSIYGADDQAQIAPSSSGGSGAGAKGGSSGAAVTVKLGECQQKLSGWFPTLVSKVIAGLALVLLFGFIYLALQDEQSETVANPVLLFNM